MHCDASSTSLNQNAMHGNTIAAAVTEDQPRHNATWKEVLLGNGHAQYTHRA